MNAINKLQEIINSSSKIVFFTGAGVSTESNIPDFRSSQGIYSEKYKYHPEVMVSHSFFYSHPKDFYEFYKEKMVYPNALPNDAHRKIAQLEEHGKVLAVITQNIDNLHQMAGSKNVLELHGSIYRNNCTKCGKDYQLDKILKEDVPHCDCGGIIKPDVVLFEEPLHEETIEQSISAIKDAEVLIVCGTSLTVYPAASFVQYFTGKHLVIINKDHTPYNQYADLVINDYVGKVLKSIVLEK